MKSLVLAGALATGLVLTPAATKPAHADGGTAAAIIAGVLVGGAIINTAVCGWPLCPFYPVATPYWGPPPAAAWGPAWGPEVVVQPRRVYYGGGYPYYRPYQRYRYYGY